MMSATIDRNAQTTEQPGLLSVLADVAPDLLALEVLVYRAALDRIRATFAHADDDASGQLDAIGTILAELSPDA